MKNESHLASPCHSSIFDQNWSRLRLKSW